MRLTSEIVQDDLEEGQELRCITEHPGFRPVCLEKLSLRLASGKYRTKAKQGYKKTGSEERCVRFTSFVYVLWVLNHFRCFMQTIECFCF